MKLVINEISKIAIYNSLPFHYEMYGFILNYATNNNIFVDIYTVSDNNVGWFDFYKNTFKNFSIKEILLYEPINDYKYIFLTTDTDNLFKPNWYNDKVIVMNHYYAIKNMYSFNYINVAKFKDSKLDYIIPCYSICNPSEKQINTNIISIIGGHEISIYGNKYNINIINKLKFKNNNPIEIHFISRYILKEDITSLNLKPNTKVYLHNSISTIEMSNILKKSSYILLSFSDSEDKREAKLASGSIQLAYTYLCKPIINSYTNKYLKLKEAFEYDENTIDDIILDEVDFEGLSRARDTYINYFPVAINNLKRNMTIPKKIIQTWETKTLSKELQQVVDSWKIYNPNYEYTLFDKDDRENFIKSHYSSEIVEAYKNIIPGAYKSDLFRYCYLYVVGGIYADIDTLCLGNLDKLMIPNINLILAIDLNNNDIDGKHNLVNGFICTRPKNFIFLDCIFSIVYNVQNNIIPYSKLDFSGPGILGQCVNKYLGNNPRASFVGKEGILNDIFFLKFEPITEEIKDIYGNLYLQNKNGNNMIIKLYEQECQKIKNFVSWTNTNKIIRENNIIRNLTNKHIALMIYGQFRTYKDNLRQNLLALKPILENNIIHIFILSDKLETGNYSLTNENEILAIFQNEFNYKVEFFYYIENYDDKEEKKYVDEFYKTIKHTTGIGNSFVPNLIYRKYFLNKLCNEFIKENSIHIDLFFYVRLFDTRILYNSNNIINNNFDKIKKTIAYLLDDDTNILFAGDLLFIGQKRSLTDIFSLWNKDGTICLFHDDIWDNISFSKIMYAYDSFLVLSKHTYSPEIQYLCRINHNNYKLQCIRIDHNNPTNIVQTNLYNIFHDPNRFNLNNYNLILDLSNENIDKINQSTNDNIYFEDKIWVLFSAISYQLHDCLITNIGVSDGYEIVMLSRFHKSNIKNVTIYSFDLQHSLSEDITKIINNCSLKIFNENIYDDKILKKYNQCLLLSKIIFINVFIHNIFLINNILEYLYSNHYTNLIIIHYRCDTENIIHKKFDQYKIIINTNLDSSTFFYSFKY